MKSVHISEDVYTDDEVNNMQVTTHTTMEVKTIDVLNPYTIQMICAERDKMKLGGILKSVVGAATYSALVYYLREVEDTVSYC